MTEPQSVDIDLTHAKWSLPTQVICKKRQQCCRETSHITFQFQTSFHKSGFRTQQPEHLLSLLNVIWMLQPIRLPAWQLLVSLHMNGCYVVSPKYAAALSLSQKYPAPKRLLDDIYAHFCSPKYHLALYVSNHIAQMIFILICLSQGNICSKGIARQLTIC